MRVLTTLMVSAVSCTATLVALAAPATAATPDPAEDSKYHAAIGKADLTGRQEVPGPGDPDGSGEFWFLAKHGTLCYSLNVRKVATPTSAHIHAGRRGVAGPIVVTLKTPFTGHSNGCIKAKRSQTTANAATTLTHRELKEIIHQPSKFYANVHNRPYPDGAVRGQLRHQ